MVVSHPSVPWATGSAAPFLASSRTSWCWARPRPACTWSPLALTLSDHAASSKSRFGGQLKGPLQGRSGRRCRRPVEGGPYVGDHNARRDEQAGRIPTAPWTVASEYFEVEQGTAAPAEPAQEPHEQPGHEAGQGPADQQPDAVDQLNQDEASDGQPDNGQPDAGQPDAGQPASRVAGETTDDTERDPLCEPLRQTTGASSRAPVRRVLPRFAHPRWTKPNSSSDKLMESQRRGGSVAGIRG